MHVIVKPRGRSQSRRSRKPQARTAQPPLEVPAHGTVLPPSAHLPPRTNQIWLGWGDIDDSQGFAAFSGALWAWGWMWMWIWMWVWTGLDWDWDWDRDWDWDWDSGHCTLYPVVLRTLDGTTWCGPPGDADGLLTTGPLHPSVPRLRDLDDAAMELRAWTEPPRRHAPYARPHAASAPRTRGLVLVPPLPPNSCHPPRGCRIGLLSDNHPCRHHAIVSRRGPPPHPESAQRAGLAGLCVAFSTFAAAVGGVVRVIFVVAVASFRLRFPARGSRARCFGGCEVSGPAERGPSERDVLAARCNSRLIGIARAERGCPSGGRCAAVAGAGVGVGVAIEAHP
ncbi:hypothetical protein B2J93_2920 [Marssonina coronariae]|uniref:Uncharacterized protein n=1 Tax=Diplocarpon coronariae TaxID=2795749 RepID=A0A218YUD1_9HELO|nr:hypothetical protein B2J93_2920 [Marssonina coronariae]